MLFFANALHSSTAGGVAITYWLYQSVAYDPLQQPHPSRAYTTAGRRPFAASV